MADAAATAILISEKTVAIALSFDQLSPNLMDML